MGSDKMPESGAMGHHETVGGVDPVLEAAEHNLKLPVADKIHQHHAQLYLEALERYPNDDAIDQIAERSVRRKLDRRILPLLGICYFFYVRKPKAEALDGAVADNAAVC